MTAQDIVPYAQIATAFIATAALVVATWSLLTQKAVARRRAAIDFFLKTEMDEKMLTAYNTYVGSKAKIASYPDIKEFCRSEHYDHVQAFDLILRHSVLHQGHLANLCRVCRIPRMLVL
jgi:hypothetical protein